jgi:hypothetical protein
LENHDPYINKLDTPEKCERYAQNVQAGSPENAKAARRRAIELQAQQFSASTGAEREALQAVFAYERVLSEKNGKKTRANRTWKMIKSRGIIPAVDHIVKKPSESSGYTILVDMGMQDMAFEAVVLRYPDLFSEEAVNHSKKRMDERSS